MSSSMNCANTVVFARRSASKPRKLLTFTPLLDCRKKPTVATFTYHGSIWRPTPDHTEPSHTARAQRPRGRIHSRCWFIYLFTAAPAESRVSSWVTMAWICTRDVPTASVRWSMLYGLPESSSPWTELGPQLRSRIPKNSSAWRHCALTYPSSNRVELFAVAYQSGSY